MADISNPSKADAIRRELAEHPDLGPKQIAELVQALYGYPVSAQYVSTIRSQQKRKLTACSPLPKRDSPRKAAIRLVESAGSLENARAALDELEQVK